MIPSLGFDLPGMLSGSYPALLLLPALAGFAISLLPSRSKALETCVAMLCGLSCLAGISAFLLIGDPVVQEHVLGYGSMLGEYRIRIDELSALVIGFSSVVYLMVVVLMRRSGIMHGKSMLGSACLLYAACVLAMCADSVILLLISWETITLMTFLMTKGAVEDFRWKYFVITHLGGLMVMTVFISMWFVSGTQILSEMAVGSIVGSAAAAVMILMVFLGFGTKLGLMPFHAWMPDLYYSAPIHSVTLLSTVCSNVAILLIVKTSFLWIGVPDNLPMILAILLLASLSAIWGAMESLIQTESRRILAYSSMENMSMVMLCLGMGLMFAAIDFDKSLLTLMIVAAMLHTINHSFFKSLMLLNIGKVEESTGEHSLSRMGGLALTLPMLSAFAVIGTLSMAGVPPLNGFVSEWLMIKTVVMAGTGDSILNIVLPLIIAVLGVCGMMAAASYARLYGFIFLGRPRAEYDVPPKPIDRLSMVPMAVLSGMCIVLGIFAVPVIGILTDSVCSTLHLSDSAGGVVAEALDPIMIAVAIAAIAAALFVLFRLFGKKRRDTPTWDCGTDLKPHMQYSSEGFTQPLVRMFHPFYGDSTETDDEPGGVDLFKVSFIEPSMHYILRPIGRSVLWLSRKVNRIQTGNIQSYLAYIMVTLIAVLLGVRFL